MDIHVWIFTFGKSCTAKTASHSAQGCGFRNSPCPHLVFTAIFNCLCLFLPSACPPLACTHCTAQLRLLWQTPAIAIPILWSSQHISLSQLGIQSPPLQWHIPQGREPLSHLPVTNSPIQCYTSTKEPTLPRECRREQRLREGEHGWEGIFLAPLNTSCPLPTSASPALERAQPTPP